MTLENGGAGGVPVMDMNRGYGDCMGFGGGWWAWILIIFVMMGGWGGNWNNRGNMGAEIFANGSMTRDQIADQFSMQDIKDGIRGVQNGLCDAFMPKTLPCLTALTEYSATLCRQAISSAASLRKIALHSNSAAARRIATSTQYVTKTRATPVILLTQ